MNLLKFLDSWANPSNFIKIFTIEEFYKATALVQKGDATWKTVGQDLYPSLAFNPKEPMLFPFLPAWIKKAKVAKFVVAEGDLLVFVTAKGKNDI